MSVGSAGNSSSSSLFNNPTLLAQMFPSINISGMEATMNNELSMTAAPLTQISNQLSTLTKQGSEWSAYANALSTLEGQAQNLKLSSTFTNATAASQNSGSAYFSVGGGSGAPIGTYSVNVSNIETNQSTLSNQQTSQTVALGLAGTLNLTFGSQTATVNVSSSDTLQTIAANFNTAAATLTGISASATVIPSSSGGVAGYTLAISANGTLGVSASGSGMSGFTLSTPTAYNAASYSLNGVSNTSNSNTIQNAIPGVTLNLIGSGTAGTFSVTNSTSSMSQSIQSMLNNIISLVKQIQTDTGKGGMFEGNATLLSLQSQLMQILQSSGSGMSTSNLGLTIGSTVTPATTAGTSPTVQQSLSINASTLSAALTSNWNGVQNFMVGTNGIAGKLASLFNTFSGGTGVIGTEQTSLQSQLTGLNSQQNLVQQMVTAQQATLQTEFTQVLTTMVQSTNQGSYLSAVINSLSGNSSNKKSGS